jgi:hypothetical protein
MALGQNPFNPSRTLKTLAAILATPNEEETYEEVHLTQEQEHQQENDELQELCAAEESEPSVVLPTQSSSPPPPGLADAALHGVAGSLVRTLAPHTEADPAAVLLQFLAAFGNLVGPAPHCRVGTTRHGLNLFVILVGESSKARKGTSWRQISDLFAEADPLWSSRFLQGRHQRPRVRLSLRKAA